MSYSVEKIDLKDIDRIKSEWDELYIGDDMTYFQSYEWNKMIVEFTPTGSGIDASYYVVKKDGQAVIIAPLWIRFDGCGIFRNKRKGVYILGRCSFSDYLNLIYRDFDKNAFLFLVKYVKEKYGNLKWHIEELNTSTQLYKFIESRGEIDRRLTCAKLVLPGNTDEYWTSLSKSVRQNLRTASNRAVKDNLTFEIEFDADDSVVEECKRLREEWGAKRAEKISKKITLKEKLCFIIKNLLTPKDKIVFPSFLPMEEDPESKVMVIRDGRKGRVAAFFNYGLDEVHKNIVVMAAGVNAVYARYSPGMLLMRAFIERMIDENRVRAIDFTRGGEPYKFQLGAKEHYNAYMDFSL